MAADTGTVAPPSEQDIADLKRLVSGIVADQGNRFIKELLRDKGLPIGRNQADFERNLNDAIEADRLTLDDINTWLDRVEGWGDQHVYLYNVSSTLKKALTKPAIERAIETKKLAKYWNAGTVLEFPDEPELTSITFDGKVLRVTWQEATEGWAPAKLPWKRKEEGLDTYEYRVFRRVDHRVVTRFEARLDLGLAAIFIGKPIAGQGSEHQRALDEARRVIGLLMSLPALKKNQVAMAAVARNMDQKNLPLDEKKPPDVQTHRSKLKIGGSWVEFAATSDKKGYASEPRILKLRDTVKEPELVHFDEASGVFLFQPGSGGGVVQRTLRVQLYGGKSRRIRLWAQMNVDEVWAILSQIASYQ